MDCKGLVMFNYSAAKQHQSIQYFQTVVHSTVSNTPLQIWNITPVILQPILSGRFAPFCGGHAYFGYFGSKKNVDVA